MYAETIETYFGVGAVGITPTFLTQKLKETTTDLTRPTNDERMAAIKVIRDKFLAALMLTGPIKHVLAP